MKLATLMLALTFATSAGAATENVWNTAAGQMMESLTALPQPKGKADLEKFQKQVAKIILTYQKQKSDSRDTEISDLREVAKEMGAMTPALTQVFDQVSSGKMAADSKLIESLAQSFGLRSGAKFDAEDCRNSKTALYIGLGLCAAAVYVVTSEPQWDKSALASMNVSSASAAIAGIGGLSILLSLDWGLSCNN